MVSQPFPAINSGGVGELRLRVRTSLASEHVRPGLAQPHTREVRRHVAEQRMPSCYLNSSTPLRTTTYLRQLDQKPSLPASARSHIRRPPNPPVRHRRKAVNLASRQNVRARIPNQPIGPRVHDSQWQSRHPEIRVATGSCMS